MIFVPLTFVTSVYGMTNMETSPEFWKFGVTLATVCVPFFLLIGFLNTDSGYRLWVEKTKAIWHWFKSKKKTGEDKAEDFEASPVSRSWTTEEARKLRMGSGQRPESGSGHARVKSDSSTTHPHILRMVEAMGEGKQSGLARMGPINVGASKEEQEAEEKESESSTAKGTATDVNEG